MKRFFTPCTFWFNLLCRGSSFDVSRKRKDSGGMNLAYDVPISGSISWVDLNFRIIKNILLSESNCFSTVLFIFGIVSQCLNGFFVLGMVKRGWKFKVGRFSTLKFERQLTLPEFRKKCSPVFGNRF